MTSNEDASVDLEAIDDVASTLPTIEQLSIHVALTAEFVSADVRDGHDGRAPRDRHR